MEQKTHVSGTIKKGRWDGLLGGLPEGLEWDVIILWRSDIKIVTLVFIYCQA